MLELVAALTVGVGLAWPQLVATMRYLPECVRSEQTAGEKQTLGSIPFWTVVRRLLALERYHWVDGVAPSETTCYPGATMLVGAIFCPLSWWHGVLLVSILLAMGRHTPLFGWTHWLHLRLPCRYLALTNLSLVVLGIGGWGHLHLTDPQYAVVCLLPVWELLVRFPSLSPPTPYCQRWMKPSDALSQPVARYFQAHPTDRRVSGLPYPHRTGLLMQVRTLGYNGAARPRWMARLRPDEGHGGRLKGWGVGHVFSYRPVLNGQTTDVPHFYQVELPEPVPTWDDLAHGRLLHQA